MQAAALIALHLLPTGYDPKLNAVSDYGIGRYRGVFWTQTLAGAVACFALAIALGDAKPSMPTLAIVLLVIAGLARLLIPVFPTDQNGSRFQTVRGTIHMVLAIVIFASLIIAASKLGSTLEHRPAWHSVKGWLTTLPWVMTGAAGRHSGCSQSPETKTDNRPHRASLLRLLNRLVLHRLDRASTHRQIDLSA